MAAAVLWQSPITMSLSACSNAGPTFDHAYGYWRGCGGVRRRSVNGRQYVGTTGGAAVGVIGREVGK